MSEVERNKHCENYSGEFGVGWGNQAHVLACEDAGCEVETVFEEKKSLSMDEMLAEIGSTHSGTQEIICK